MLVFHFSLGELYLWEYQSPRFSCSSREGFVCVALCACCLPHVLKSNVIFWLTVFWGGKGEMRNPAMELSPPAPFLVYDRLGLGVGALIEECQGGSVNWIVPKNSRNAGVSFSLKIITSVLVNDFQMVYMKQSVPKGWCGCQREIAGDAEFLGQMGNPQLPHPTAGMFPAHAFGDNSFYKDVSPSSLCPLLSPPEGGGLVITWSLALPFRLASFEYNCPIFLMHADH